MTSRPAVLFVDDEPRVLDGIRRSLRHRRHEWDMAFQPGGDEALEHLAHARCDVVVSDMRMPGMDGAQLLGQVCERHPGVARVVLSGHTEREAAVRASVVGHRFLSKPSDGDALADTVAQLATTSDAPDRIGLRRAAGRVRCLPVPSKQLERVAATLSRPNVELTAVVEVVVQSIGLAAKLLQLANSSFFGAEKRVTSVTYAVTALGLPTLQALMATDPGLWAAPAVDLAEADQFAAVSRHSVAAARLAREVASPGNAPYAEVAALLQDAGRLALAHETGTSGPAAGGTGADVGPGLLHVNDVGAELLHLWGLPRPIVVAVSQRYVPGGAYPCGLGVGGALRVAHLLLQRTACADPYDGTHEDELGMLLSHPQLSSGSTDWLARAHQVADEAAQAMA